METKICNNCKLEKSLEDFMRHTGIKSGRGPKCKVCNNAYYAKRRIEKYELVRTYEKKFHYERRLRYEYNITVEQHQQMLIEANGKCALCYREDKLVIDHCHNTGKVRGLLCSHCNTGLGQFRDDIEALQRSIEYLKQNA